MFFIEIYDHNPLLLWIIFLIRILLRISFYITICQSIYNDFLVKKIVSTVEFYFGIVRSGSKTKDDRQLFLVLPKLPVKFFKALGLHHYKFQILNLKL